jgi:glycosyltransferase involved in cell wall biosynthesis
MDSMTAEPSTELATVDADAGKPRVLIIVRDIDGDPAGQAAFDVATHLAANNVPSQMLSSGGRLLTGLLRRKVTHVEWQVPGDGPIGHMKATKRIAQMIRDNDYNIVHVFGRIVPGAVRAACQKTGAKMIASFPGTYPTDGWREGRRTKSLAKADHFIASSGYVRNYLVDELNIPLARIATIAPGVDMAHFNPGAVKGQRMIELVRHHGIPEEHKVILMPARLIPWKGQRKVIEAFARLNGQNTTLLIAGDSNRDAAYSDALQTQVEDARMAGQIRFLDLIDDMPALYMLSDVVIEAPEQPVAFARASAEAQAMGRPVVTSAVGSGPEAVIEGKTGWLAAPGDVDGITLALKKALDLDVDARKRLALAARSHARSSFDLNACMAEVEAVYETLLA